MSNEAPVPVSAFGPFPNNRLPAPDPIIGLASEFQNDTRSDKLNAGIGYLNTENGEIFRPTAVTEAAHNLNLFPNEGYVTPDPETYWGGDQTYLQGVVNMAFERYAPFYLENGLIAAVSTAGGTHGISLTAELLARRGLFGGEETNKVALAVPAYPNHESIFNNIGVPIEKYPHLTQDGKFNLPAAIKAARQSNRHTVLLFQGLHNPSGMNASTESEWRTIAQEMHRAGSTAFFDIAYDGLGESFSGHAGMIPTFVEEQVPVIAAYSFSKIAGMYSQRVGAVVTLGSSREDARNTTNAMNEVVRFQISSQPIPGQLIMRELFSTPHLNQRWMHEELPEMAAILTARRTQLANSLPSVDSENIMKGEGMFTLLPISLLGVTKLKEEKGVYIVPTAHGARVNIGGVPTRQIPKLASALRDGLDNYHT